jgi:hypothetical protein
MTIVDICLQSVKQHQAYEIRQESIQEGVYHYEMRMALSLPRNGWVLLDVQSANAVLTVYRALKSENQARFTQVEASRLISWCWEQVV